MLDKALVAYLDIRSTACGNDEARFSRKMKGGGDHILLSKEEEVPRSSASKAESIAKFALYTSSSVSMQCQTT